MGRSKKANAQPAEKDAPAVFCYFCDRGFPEERVLIQHQLTKHFSCPEKECRGRGGAGRCNTLHGLIIHYRKVHVQELKAVPNSIEGRDDPMSNMIIFGTRNVPEEVMEEWQAKSAAPHEIFGASVAGDTNSGPEPVIMGTFATLPELVLPTQTPRPGGLAGGLALPSQGGTAAGGPDLAAQVAAWMSLKPPEPQEEQQPPLPPEVEAPPPSNGNRLLAPSLAPPGFSFPQPSTGFSASSSQPNPIHIDTAATNAMAEAMQNARLASLASSQAAPPSLDPMAQALAVRDARGTLTALAVPESRAPRSPSRDRRDYRDGNRSSSRGRRDSRRSRSRDGGGRQDYQRQDYQNNQGRQMQQQQQQLQQQAPNRAPTSVEARTIQITQGTVGTRLILKKAMEGFGRVEVCHTGNRSNPELDPPWVRFEKAFAAEAALAALQTGQVMLMGAPIMGTLKLGGRPPQPPREIPRRDQRNMEVTSRDLAFESRGGDRGGGRRSRSRSPPRRRSRTPPRRDDSRSRGGRGRHEERRR